MMRIHPSVNPWNRLSAVLGIFLSLTFGSMGCGVGTIQCNITNGMVTCKQVGDASQVSPGSLSFGNQVVNTQSAAQNVTVTNGGTTAFNVLSIAASSSLFIVSGFTGTTALAPGQSLTVGVAFKPTAAQAYNDVIHIVYDSGLPDDLVQLAGTGVSTPPPPDT